MHKHLLLMLLFMSSSVMATEFNCSGTTQIGGAYTLPNTGRNITPPNTGNAGRMGTECTATTCVVLFTTKTSIPGSKGTMNQLCNSSSSGFQSGYSVTNIPAGIIYNYGAYKIYPTTIKGIGVSFNEANQSSRPAYPSWPEVVWLYPNHSQVDTWVDIRVWKTPEFTTQSGDISFTGPTFMQVLSPLSAGDTIKSCPNNTSEGKLDDRTCVWFSRVLKGSANFQSGTCELVSSSRTVHLGSYAADVGKSPWKDASFKLQCPTAYGYNSAVSNSVNQYDVNDGSQTGNQTQNNTVKIQIIPYSQVVNATQGIFALEAGGAEGYGIQLAWGMPGEQTTADTPAKPVVFGVGTLASSLNSNFKNGPYAYGGNALATGADGTIKMSARYIRTTGNTKPGPANARVEIIAAYE